MPQLPRKLTRDAIAEAIFEVRFESAESQQFPEVALGKLASETEWLGFETVRLPLAEFPPMVRLQSPELKYQPVMELRCLEKGRIAKIGSNVFSYHALAPYPGWEKLEPEIGRRIEFVFQHLHDFRATRLGLRYINLLDAVDHGIAEISDLNFSIQLDGHRLEASQLLQFERGTGEEHMVQVRVASPHFVQGAKKPFTALIDVDVSTPSTVTMTDVAKTMTWLSKAHDYEKQQFFELLRPETIIALTEA